MTLRSRLAAAAMPVALAASTALNAATVNEFEFTATDEQRTKAAQAPTEKTQTEQKTEAVESTGVKTGFGGLLKAGRSVGNFGKAVTGAVVPSIGSRRLLAADIEKRAATSHVVIVFSDDKDDFTAVSKAFKEQDVPGTFSIGYVNDGKGSNLHDDFDGVKKDHGVRSGRPMVAVYARGKEDPVATSIPKDLDSAAEAAAFVAKLPPFEPPVVAPAATTATNAPPKVEVPKVPDAPAVPAVPAVPKAPGLQ